MARRMECIDIDKLMREFTNSPLHDNSHNTVDELKVLLKMIDEAEIIECQPVVHAEWEEIKLTDCMINYWKCSKCNKTGTAIRFKYCPHCGARMDGEKNA